MSSTAISHGKLRRAGLRTRLSAITDNHQPRSLIQVVQVAHEAHEAHEGAPLRVHGLGKVVEILDNIFIVEIDLSEHGRWIYCDVGRAVKHGQH